MADDTRVCSPSGAPGGWCAREAADCAARCALEVEYAAEASELGKFLASLTVVNNNALEAGDVSQRQGSRDGRHGRDVVDGVRIEFTTSLALAIDEWLPRTQVGLYRCLFSTRVCCVWPAACLRVLARVLAHWIKVRARQGGL